jgi:L-alanine-DL-glutamate epimerase-like enolase superfamily enzyme
MQMMDRDGFHRVLHFAAPEGMECGIYCHVVSDVATAAADLCLAVTSANYNGQPVKVQAISTFVREHYMADAHPPLRSTMPGVEHTPNGGSTRTPHDVGLWCDSVTDAMTRYHVLVNHLRPRKRKKHAAASLADSDRHRRRNG